MKNLVLIFTLFIGLVTGLNAQNCKPCPPDAVCPKVCCVTACNPMGTSASASVLPVSIDFASMFAAEAKPACLEAASTSNAITPACQPINIAACQSAGKAVSNDVKSCQPASNAAAKTGCQPGPGKTTNAAEKAIDQQYHQVPKPIKS